MLGGVQRYATGVALGGTLCSAMSPDGAALAGQTAMTNNRIYKMSFAIVYPHYVAKPEGKGRTKTEVDEIIRWLTGYSQDEFNVQLDQQTDW